MNENKLSNDRQVPLVIIDPQKIHQIFLGGVMGNLL
jgi:hypothetical protein